MIARYEKSAERRLELAERLGGPRGVDGGAIVEITSDEDGVGPLPHYERGDAAERAPIAHMTEMKVADQSGFAAEPGLRKIFETHADALDTRQAGVDDGRGRDD